MGKFLLWLLWATELCLYDYTYGVPSHGFPGFDFGDGIERHAVPLYEGFTMLSFGLIAAWQLQRKYPRWWRHAFYYFAIVYGAQRFVWEFLKPYPATIGGLTLFQYLCLFLIIYGAAMLRRDDDHAGRPQIRGPVQDETSWTAP